MYNNNVINIQMSSGYKINGVDLYNYFQPYFSGSNLASISVYKKNGVQAFARRDNNPNNAPSISTTGYKSNGVDIATLINGVNPNLEIQLTGSATYNGQAQQPTVNLISPTDSWITVTTSSQINAGNYTENSFTYSYPSGYVLTKASSNFTIYASPLNISLNGSSNLIWNGSSQTFSNYTISGTYAQDTGWVVNGRSQTSVGNYTAYISISSSNYSLGNTTTLNWNIIPSSAPGPPTIGTPSAGDKSFTANWTAPTVTGGQLSGYYVSYSTNGGTSWSQEQSTTSTTYTWFGNGIIFNGNSYIARVRAYNSLAIGDYSSNSTSVVPTFAAPTLTIVPVPPSTSNPGYRAFTVNFTPTACVNYASTYIFILSPYDSFGTYYNSANGGFYNTGTTTTGNQNIGPIFSVYAQNIFSGSTFFTVGTNETYYAYAVTYNNDNYSVASAPVSGYMEARQYNPPVYTITSYSSSTGTFNVTGNTFTQTSTYAIPDNDTTITGLTVNAASNGTVTICTTGRHFIVYFANQSTTNFNQSLSGLQPPWSTNSGTTVRSLAWPSLTASGYNQYLNGKIKVNGAGTIGNWATNQRTNVTVSIFGQQRINTGY